jgi:hypothetical protein
MYAVPFSKFSHTERRTCHLSNHAWGTSVAMVALGSNTVNGQRIRPRRSADDPCPFFATGKERKEMSCYGLPKHVASRYEDASVQQKSNEDPRERKSPNYVPVASWKVTRRPADPRVLVFLPQGVHVFALLMCCFIDNNVGVFGDVFLVNGEYGCCW